MPEAVSEVIRYLFEDCGLDFITYEYFLYNRQSARVQEKCGFHFLKAVDYSTRMGTVEPSNANIIWKKKLGCRIRQSNFFYKFKRYILKNFLMAQLSFLSMLFYIFFNDIHQSIQLFNLLCRHAV